MSGCTIPSFTSRFLVTRKFPSRDFGTTRLRSQQMPRCYRLSVPLRASPTKQPCPGLSPYAAHCEGSRHGEASLGAVQQEEATIEIDQAQRMPKRIGTRRRGRVHGAAPCHRLATVGPTQVTKAPKQCVAPTRRRLESEPESRTQSKKSVSLRWISLTNVSTVLPRLRRNDVITSFDDEIFNLNFGQKN